MVVVWRPSAASGLGQQGQTHRLGSVVGALWGPQTSSPRPPVCIHSRSHDQLVVNNILELALQIHHPTHNEYKKYTTGHMTQSKITASQGRQHIKQRKSSKAIVIEPKSRLDYLQATDWETILVRTGVNVLLHVELLLKLLLKVWPMK